MSEPQISEPSPAPHYAAGVAHLGKVSNAPTERLDLVRWTGKPGLTVLLDCTEFTSHCPVTGQPDFARLEIEYEPAFHLIETKSLKLYLQTWRHKKEFNEVIADAIADAVFAQAKPTRLRVTMRFHPRGGIAPTVEAVRGLA